MRKQLRYTQSQITKGLYTTGQEWQTDLGEEYVGLYHRYDTGEVYTESEFNERSKPLFPYEELTAEVKRYRELNNSKLDFADFIEFRPQPMPGDKIIQRYFVKKVNEQKIKEISESQYNEFLSSKLDNISYTAIEIPWQVSGNLEDSIENGARNFGILSFNQNSLSRAQQTIPEIGSIITTLTDLVYDDSFIVPKDIN